VPGSELPLRRFAGLFIAAGVVIALEVLGRPPGLDPAVLVPLAVLAAAALDGWMGAGLAGLVGGLYLVLYYTQPAEAALPGGMMRAAVGLVAAGCAAWIAVLLREAAEPERARVAAELRRSQRLIPFAMRGANEPAETMPEVIVDGAAQLLAAQMAVLTIVDPANGRHFVRAARGSSSTALGIEVLPGVGITGQAISDRSLVMSGKAPDDYSVSLLQRRLSGRRTAQTMAAVAGVQAGRVIATLTVGRGNGEEFTSVDREMLEAIAPIITLAVAGTLARRALEQGALRDPLTGLYNAGYLEAALEQLIALRSRTAPERRAPLSAIVFDIDELGELNERHGRRTGNDTLRAMAALLVQRFRASDVVARSGPGSFTVILNGAVIDVAAETAAQIIRQVTLLHIVDEQYRAVRVRVSAGWAGYHDGDASQSFIDAVWADLDARRAATAHATDL